MLCLLDCILHNATDGAQALEGQTGAHSGWEAVTYHVTVRWRPTIMVSGYMLLKGNRDGTGVSLAQKSDSLFCFLGQRKIKYDEYQI